MKPEEASQILSNVGRGMSSADMATLRVMADIAVQLTRIADAAEKPK